MLNEARIEELSPWSDLVYKHVCGMLERKVPIHAMGFHALREASWAAKDDNIASMVKNWERFAALGLKIYITEMGLMIPSATGENLEIQARGYKNLVTAALSMRPSFKGFIVFGIADHLHWTVHQYKEFWNPLLFDANYTPKPAYAAIRNAFEMARPI
jgi:endo-1,4-beta-xylanase